MTLAILTAFLFGLTAGTMNLAGLWFTARRLINAESSPLLLLVSAYLRLAFLSGALIWIMDESWQALLSAVAGLMLARFAIVWIVSLPHDARRRFLNNARSRI